MFGYIKELYAGLSARERYGLIGGAILILVATLLLAWWSMRTDYEVLFGDLEPRDAAAVVKELEEQKIGYKLGAGGTQILVDRSKVHESRLKLMGKGVPLTGTVGFEIFDQSDIGMTEYSQKINYQRALQGELARTITSIDAVKYARVHLVLPNTSIFRQKGTNPKASVSVVIRPGKRLNQQQIKGIQRLVAAAVPELEPMTVTIVNQSGLTLTTDQSDSSEIAKAANQLDLKRQVEYELTKKVVKVLDRTFGPGKAIVSVDVTLGMDHIRRTIESIVPVDVVDGRSRGLVVRKRTSVQERPALVKTAGIGASVPSASSGPRSTTTEYEYKHGRSVEQVVSTPGGIKRLSVSVLVPGNMDQDAIDKVQNIVAMTVGLNSARGDGIAVYPITYVTTDSTSAGEKSANASQVEIVAESGAKTDMRGRNRGDIEAFVARIRQWLSRNKALPIALGGAIVALGLIAFVWLFVTRKRAVGGNGSRRLSDDERQRLLAEIRRWLQSGDVAQQEQP